MSFFVMASQFSSNSWLVLGVYGFVGFLYLVLVPLLLYFWMDSRWNFMGKFERLSIYGLVFLFFPGLILYAPLLNLRIHGQGEN